MESKTKDGEVVKLQCATPFGVVDVLWFQSGKCDLFNLETCDAKGNHSLIVVPARQCAFEISKSPKTDKPKVIGFRHEGGYSVV